MTNIEDCPFCTSKEVRPSGSMSWTYVYCGHCGAKGPSVHHGGPTDDRARLNAAEEEAVAKWNKAAISSKIEEQALVIRELLEALQGMDDTLCKGFDTQSGRMAGRKALIAARAAIAKAKPLPNPLDPQ